MKIDVEGAEASVIAGAATVLSSMRPLMLIEVNDKALRAQGNCADSLMATLRDDLRYEIFVFSPVTGLLERPTRRRPALRQRRGHTGRAGRRHGHGGLSRRPRLPRECQDD